MQGLAEPFILDVRHMRGLGEAAGPEHVVADAEAFLERRRIKRVVTGKTVKAYINGGRWVADCPNDNGGIACLPGHDEATCLSCGHAYKVKWPAAKTMSAALTVLLAREKPENRNWRPGDESVQDLKAENITRGVPLR